MLRKIPHVLLNTLLNIAAIQNLVFFLHIASKNCVSQQTSRASVQTYFLCFLGYTSISAELTTRFIEVMEKGFVSDAHVNSSREGMLTWRNRLALYMQKNGASVTPGIMNAFYCLWFVSLYFPEWTYVLFATRKQQWAFFSRLIFKCAPLASASRHAHSKYRYKEPHHSVPCTCKFRMISSEPQLLLAMQL